MIHVARESPFLATTVNCGAPAKNLRSGSDETCDLVRLAHAAPLIHASVADACVGGAWNPLCDIKSSTTPGLARMSVTDACGSVC